MIVWILLLGGAAVVGLLCGTFSSANRALLAGAALPVAGLFAALMYNEYFIPYSGGGASMWPVALIFGGVPAAVFGLVGAFVAQEVRERHRRKLGIAP